jgi:Mn2+/Fe2+ NRAMP family transporter
MVLAAAAAILIAVSLSGAYRRAEMVALGLCFCSNSCSSRPRSRRIRSAAVDLARRHLGSQPLGNQAYLLLVAGNIGAVIMPWMIFYQQSATVDKKLKVADMPFARIDTALGSIATQCIMIAVVVTTAATLFVHHIPGRRCGARGARARAAGRAEFAGVAFGAGLIGAAMLGAFVVSLATAWAFGEAFNWPCSLDHPVCKRSASTGCIRS